MAKYGAWGIEFTPFSAEDAEPDGAFPVYDATKTASLGALQKWTDSFDNDEVEMYGDDQLEEYLDSIPSGTGDVESCQLLPDAERVVFGLAASGDLEYGMDQNPPWGCVTFGRSIRYHGVQYYQGLYFPCCKARTQGEEDETKAKSMNFRGDKLRFKLKPAKNGIIKVKSPWLSSVAAVKDWIAAKITPPETAEEVPAGTGTT